MIGKNDFIKYIDFLKRQEAFGNELQTLLEKFSDVVSDGMIPSFYSAPLIVEILEKSLGLKEDEHGYTTLSYWIFEKDFGESFEVGDIEEISLPKTHKYRTPNLKKAEDLYDYIIWETSQYNEEKEM